MIVCPAAAGAHHAQQLAPGIVGKRLAILHELAQAFSYVGVTGHKRTGEGRQFSHIVRFSVDLPSGVAVLILRNLQGSNPADFTQRRRGNVHASAAQTAGSPSYPDPLADPNFI